ncbi:MAG TPA: hypothetical protein VIY48_17465 [Candidatus Paceibacterota bacterium]
MLHVQQLIERLEKILDEHGNVKVMVYNNDTDDTGDDIDVEFNDDDKPVCMISYYPIEN